VGSNVSNVVGDHNYVRVQVRTNAGALDRAKQFDAVSRLTADVPKAAGTRPSPTAPVCS
jgi:hypothetical protein